MAAVPLSILDLAPIVEGGDAGQSLRNALDLGRHAERWGYRRIWFAEHHNMAGVASAATSLVIGHVAAGTSSIRVGAGGIMLPNHAPLVIAEQFGTLQALFPGRIDLGVGRAPGTDQLTARALRRHLAGNPDGFPEDLAELMAYLGPPRPGMPIQAVPCANGQVPVYILGSSMYGAELAAAAGLPYAFASHFAPGFLAPAIAHYRTNFQPSPQLARPHLILGVNVIAADEDRAARRLLTSLEQVFVQLRRGRPGPLPPPVDALELLPHERATLDEALACTFVGTPDTVRRGLESFVARTGADELIVAAHIYDHQARLHSYQLAAGLGPQPASIAGPG